MLGFKRTNTLFTASQTAARAADIPSDVNVSKALNIQFLQPNI